MPRNNFSLEPPPRTFRYAGSPLPRRAAEGNRNRIGASGRERKIAEDCQEAHRFHMCPVGRRDLAARRDTRVGRFPNWRDVDPSFAGSPRESRPRKGLGRVPVEGAGRADLVCFALTSAGGISAAVRCAHLPPRATSRCEISCRRAPPGVGRFHRSQCGRTVEAHPLGGQVDTCGRTALRLPVDPGRARTADRSMTSQPGRRLHEPGGSFPWTDRGCPTRFSGGRFPWSVLSAGFVQRSPAAHAIPMGQGGEGWLPDIFRRNVAGRIGRLLQFGDLRKDPATAYIGRGVVHRHNVSERSAAKDVGPRSMEGLRRNSPLRRSDGVGCPSSARGTKRRRLDPAMRETTTHGKKIIRRSARTARRFRGQM